MKVRAASNMKAIVRIAGKTIGYAGDVMFSIDHHIQPVYVLGRQSFQPIMEASQSTVTVFLKKVTSAAPNYNQLQGTPVEIEVIDRDGNTQLHAKDMRLVSMNQSVGSKGIQENEFHFVGNMGDAPPNGIQRALDVMKGDK
jgi:hypothetical protein